MSSIPLASNTSRKKIVKRTRNKTNFFLIGYPSKSITGCKLPTLRQVFKVLLHEKNVPKKNRRTAWSQAEYVLDCVLEFWRMAGIKTITNNNCVMRIQKNVLGVVRFGEKQESDSRCRRKTSVIYFGACQTLGYWCQKCYCNYTWKSVVNGFE